jgi:hypothetical protein
MKIKSLLTAILIILSLLIENAYCTPHDYYPSVKIPVIADSYNLTKVYDNPKYTKSLDYYIKSKYPADTVISFYNSRFKNNGWILSTKEFSRDWESFTDGTRKGNPKIKQRLSLWINPKLCLEAFLALRYEKKNKNWSDLHVLCQIQPKIDYSMLKQFIERLQKDKAHIYHRFMGQIQAILENNGEINEKKFNQAVAQNKDLAPYLNEYKKMADKINAEIKEILIKNR